MLWHVLQLNVGPFIIGLVLLAIGAWILRHPDFEGDQYFREGRPDYIRWGLGVFRDDDDPENIRLSFRTRAYIIGATLCFFGLVALYMSFALRAV
jgi:hypothetical protein